MNPNVAKRLGLPQRQVIQSCSELSDTSRNIGIEIEVEQVNRSRLQEELGHLWDITQDGSLRPREYSAELRSPNPGYAGKALVESIDAAHNSPQLNRGDFSWRCANHIHVDMRDKSSEDIAAAMVMYSLIEPYIFAWDGTGRHESRFCMPWWVCAADINTACNIATTQNDNEFGVLISRFSKYTAMNLEPLRRFGTIEFRHAQATNNRDRLLYYINLCMNICNTRDRYPGTDLMEMVLEYMTDGPTAFISRWLDPDVADTLVQLPIGEMPLTQTVFDMAISTAMTLAELHQYNTPATPTEVNPEMLSKIL